MKRRNFLQLGFAGIGTFAFTKKTQALEYYLTKNASLFTAHGAAVHETRLYGFRKAWVV